VGPGDFNMTIPKPGEVDLDNVINVTMEDLNDTQKQLLQKASTSKHALGLSAPPGKERLVAEPPELIRLKCANHHDRGNPG
jgi:hypothetical protein